MAEVLTGREAIRAATGPVLLVALGALFLLDYSGGFDVRQTWPVVLILFGLSLALQSMSGSQPRPMPRGRPSLVGPMLLIALGALLLANNLDPQISIRAWFANYWPWILIFWGAFRLLELLIVPRWGWAVPRNLGVGAVFLVLLLVLAGTGARSELPDFEGIHIEVDGPFGPFSKTYEFPLQESAELTPDATLLLRDLRGRIRVVGSEGTGLSLKGDVQVRAGTPEDAEDLNTPLDISREEGRVTLRPRALSKETARRISYDIEIRIPNSTVLISESPAAEIFVENLSRSVTFDAGRGKIHLKGIGGPVRVEADRAKSVEADDLANGFDLRGNTSRVELRSVDGPVRIQGDLFGTVRLAELRSEAEVQSRYGEVRLGKLPGELEIKVRSLFGEGIEERLEIRSERWRRVRLKDVNGEVDIQGRRMRAELSLGSSFGSIDTRVDRGDIEVRIPSNAQFSLDAATNRGKIRHSFGTAFVSSRRGSNLTLKGRVGDGPHLQLRTDRGDIVLSTSDGEDPKDAESEIVLQEATGRDVDTQRERTETAKSL